MKYSLLLGASLTLACAGSGSGNTAVKPRDVRAEAKVTAAVERRDNLAREFAGVPEEHRQRCEFQAGDCRLEVSDRRSSLLESYRTESCRPGDDREAHFQCVMRELAAAGDPAVAVGYYDFESRCLEQLVQCASKVEGQTLTAKREQRARQRKERIEGSREGFELRALSAFAAEKVAYLRAALPPADDEVCRDVERSTKCEAEVTSLYDQFEEELAKEEAEYKDTAALELYSASAKAAAKCHKPDLDCLTAKLDTYGGNPETRKSLKASLDVLERREHLVAQTSGAAAERCLVAGVKKHQGRIVESYQRFAREPVTYFQSQLHRSFMSLYDQQVSCLKGLKRPPAVPLAALAPETPAAEASR